MGGIAPVVYLSRRGAHEPERQAIARCLRYIYSADGVDPLLSHHASGAPYLVEHPGMALSISHCATWVSVALSPLQVGHIGVDVEDKWSQAGRLLERYATPSEVYLLQQSHCPPIALWCAKEAAFKACPRGVPNFTTDIALTAVEWFAEPIVWEHHDTEGRAVADTSQTPLSPECSCLMRMSVRDASDMINMLSVEVHMFSAHEELQPWVLAYTLNAEVKNLWPPIAVIVQRI